MGTTRCLAVLECTKDKRSRSTKIVIARKTALLEEPQVDQEDPRGVCIFLHDKPTDGVVLDNLQANIYRGTNYYSKHDDASDILTIICIEYCPQKERLT